ncbi:hypothetical protein JCM4814A_04790 [Streptomyces phaeofaciens JCM 4814]|uniref:Uncharacterized protein n=1 Tax=Streptomyces phaeofaciens TaxID=68254 RepID=A0A918HDI8_9ACTN|nr:hypothetical protein GCM10010226_35720 [Streptomyces phaeofaciens]
MCGVAARGGDRGGDQGWGPAGCRWLRRGPGARVPVAVPVPGRGTGTVVTGHPMAGHLRRTRAPEDGRVPGERAGRVPWTVRPGAGLRAPDSRCRTPGAGLQVPGRPWRDTGRTRPFRDTGSPRHATRAVRRRLVR